MVCFAEGDGESPVGVIMVVEEEDCVGLEGIAHAK